jgi:transcriptional regulator with XRE-family HTH domain
MDPSPSPRAPASDTIAAFVKLQRGLYGWKRETLAALAEVSLSTVERVERGDSVRASSLEKLAVALRLSPGAFTIPRVPLSEGEAIAMLEESFAWMDGKVPVRVAPLRGEAQLRTLTESDVVIVASDLEGDEAAREVDGLREYLDLTNFVRAEDGTLLPKRERSFRIRRLYKDVLDAVLRIERSYKAVCLAGTYEGKSSTSSETFSVAVVAVRSRERNPAAGKITQLLADPTIDMRAAMQNYLEWMS